jgi:signal transduction histidine kinase/CheY-like chemotaxis protein
MSDSFNKKKPLRILLIEGPEPIAGPLLAASPGFELVRVERISSAGRLFETSISEGQAFDILLLDLTTSAATLNPQDEGLDAFRLARALLPGIAIVTLGSSARGNIVDTLISEGAQACLEKSGLNGEILAAHMEQAVLRNHAESRRFRALFDSAPIGILLAVGRRIVMANPEALITLGKSEKDLGSLSVLDLFPTDSRTTLEKALDTHEGLEIQEAAFDASFSRIEGNPQPCRVYVKGALLNNAPAVALYLAPLAGAKLYQDLEKPKIQFQNKEKMAALARLAGGAAHDFNNLLTAINGYSEHLLTLAGDSEPLNKGLKAICRAGDAAVELTRRMLSFSATEPVEAKPIVIDEALSSMANHLEKMVGPEIDFVMKLQVPDHSANWPIEKLDQVMVILCMNAKEAMPQGGTLTLSSLAINDNGFSPDSKTIYTHLEARLKPGMVITVEDTGHGMDEEILRCLGEPFFSTKQGGRGTGLGLASVYGILKQLGGGLSIESHPEAGSRIQLYFPAQPSINPRADQKEDQKMESNSRPNPASPLKGFGNGETVLVVDDDSSIREMLLAVLGRFGYKTLEATSAYEALEFIEQEPNGVDLVLTDVLLHGEGGHELGEKIQLIKPGLQTVYISGHSLESLEDLGIKIPAAVFLEKPFTPVQLANKVKTILDTARFMS